MNGLLGKLTIWPERFGDRMHCTHCIQGSSIWTGALHKLCDWIVTSTKSCHIHDQVDKCMLQTTNTLLVVSIVLKSNFLPWQMFSNVLQLRLI